LNVDAIEEKLKQLMNLIFESITPLVLEEARPGSLSYKKQTKKQRDANQENIHGNNEPSVKDKEFQLQNTKKQTKICCNTL
jgi:hypothetical protein